MSSILLANLYILFCEKKYLSQILFSILESSIGWTSLRIYFWKFVEHWRAGGRLIINWEWEPWLCWSGKCLALRVDEKIFIINWEWDLRLFWSGKNLALRVDEKVRYWLLTVSGNPDYFGQGNALSIVVERRWG